MKQQILNLKKKLLLVEIEHFDPVKIVDEKNISYFGQKLNKIGKLTDITESQFEQWVERIDFGSEEIKVYEDYLYNSSSLRTAKKSFFSKLKADGIYFENPLGDCPPKITETEDDVFGMVSALRSQRIGKWREAESKVWVLSNCYLFQILN